MIAFAKGASVSMGRSAWRTRALSSWVLPGNQALPCASREPAGATGQQPGHQPRGQPEDERGPRTRREHRPPDAQPRRQEQDGAGDRRHGSHGRVLGPARHATGDGRPTLALQSSMLFPALCPAVLTSMERQAPS
jgi:hypothetical protein